MQPLLFSRIPFVLDCVKDRTVLDVGCVDHNLATRTPDKWLHGRMRAVARHVTGIDYARDGIETMRQEGYDAEWCDANNFDLGRTFDVIVAGEFLEHTPLPGAFLTSAARHLEPGGLLLLTTPNANCLLYFLENCLLGHELDNTDHVCIFSPTTMRCLLAKCGLRAVSFHFVAENLAHYQKTPLRKTIARAMWATQAAAGLLRPSLCRHFITVAERPSA